MQKKIKQMAKKVGYDDVKYVGKWKKCKVYEPIFTDDEIHFIGFPQYILCENGSLRWTQGTEGLDIFADLNG